MRPHRPREPTVGVACGVAERHARGRAIRLQALDQFAKSAEVFREFLEAALLHGGDTVVHKAAARSHRNAEPLVAALAVGHTRGRPAAVLLAEIFGDVSHIDALFGKQMRQGVKPPHHVEPLPGVGRDRSLGLNVIERFIGDVDLDAGRLLEGIDDLHEGDILGLHKPFPAQHVDGGAGFRLPLGGLRPGLGGAEHLVG